MNRYNPNNHHRKSIRFKDYDYSREGLYYVTICCKNRASLFGYIVNNEMILNDAGKMIEKWYFELENKFNDIKCHEMQVMPNHIHFIVENIGVIVGANLCVRPGNTGQTNFEIMQTHFETGQTHRSAPTETSEPILGEHIGSPLHRVLQWFKTMTTNEYIRGVKNLNWEPFDKKLWQRNYWEHIVRDENSYFKITNYIINNPMNWKEDILNLENPNIK
jgi:putative transposase